MHDAFYVKRDLIKIQPYEPNNHARNYYYFRFGAEKVGNKVEGLKKPLTIPKNGFARVWSMEDFELSDRILGLFGNISTFVDKGLQLIHSPSIDPGFNGSLALGIRNNTNEKLTIQPGENIGKILFFDVSDTIISAEEFVTDALKRQELKAREEAGDMMEKIYIDYMKTVVKAKNE